MSVMTEYDWLELESLKVNPLLSDSGFMAVEGLEQKSTGRTVWLMSPWFCGAFLLQTVLSRVFFAVLCRD